MLGDGERFEQHYTMLRRLYHGFHIPYDHSKSSIGTSKLNKTPDIASCHHQPYSLLQRKVPGHSQQQSKCSLQCFCSLQKVLPNPRCLEAHGLTANYNINNKNIESMCIIILKYIHNFTYLYRFSHQIYQISNLLWNPARLLSAAIPCGCVFCSSLPRCFLFKYWFLISHIIKHLPISFFNRCFLVMLNRKRLISAFS